MLSKKAIWYIDLTRLISQQITCRKLKPVAFLVYVNFDVCMNQYVLQNYLYEGCKASIKF